MLWRLWTKAFRLFWHFFYIPAFAVIHEPLTLKCHRWCLSYPTSSTTNMPLFFLIGQIKARRYNFQIRVAPIFHSTQSYIQFSDNDKYETLILLIASLQKKTTFIHNLDKQYNDNYKQNMLLNENESLLFEVCWNSYN